MKNKKFRPYLVGFGLSIILTILAFGVAWIHVGSAHETISHLLLIQVVLGLALIQFIVQLFCFMGTEIKQKWNLLMLFSTISLVFIVVAGSIWIISHLNTNMTTQQVNQYVQSQDGF